MAKKKIRIEREVERAAAAAHLETILEGLRIGAMTVAHNGETLALKPGATVALEIVAAQKDGRESVELSISWERPTAPATPPADDFRIVAGEADG